MIFKKLFRPKHQHPDPQIRIQGIQALLPEQAEHKSDLHELAFNDEDPSVNLAALKRLNSFALWCKMAETAKSERIRKKAQAMVEDALFERGDLQLSEQERQRFVAECKSTALLEKLLNLPWLKSDQSGLLVQVLDKINKPHVMQQVFVQSDIESVQLSLINRIDEQSILNKCLKKTSFDSVKQQIRDKLEAAFIAKTRPIEVEKQTRMVLSQLLALKDKSDYAEIQDKYQELVEQYQQLAAQFSCLKADVKSNLIERFEDISRKVQASLEQLAPQWQANQAARALEQRITTLSDAARQCMAGVDELLQGDLEQVDTTSLTSIELELQQFQKQIDDVLSDISRQQVDLRVKLERLRHDITATLTTLNALPKLQQAIERAVEFLTVFAALPLPTDHSQVDASASYIKDQRFQWKQLTAPYQSYWPKTLSTQWDELHQRWRAAIKQLKESIKQNETRCRTKLKAIEQLVNQGKFKAAMSLYARVESWYFGLPERNQAYLQRSFDKVKNEIENLKDWQHYIAQPRKPALLKEAEAIRDKPLGIDKQASEVKRLRSEWNSLGKIDSEADSALNSAFESTLESAFEPCRQHYAQLQQEREDNLAKKQSVLKELDALTHSELDDKHVADQLASLQKQWRQIGKVDYKMLSELNEQYQASIDPVKQRVENYYQTNAEQKQSLLNKSLKLMEFEDIDLAIEQAKQLQKQWKHIGFAGPKRDGSLWQEFRQSNDQVFAKRQSLQDDAKQAIKQQINEFQLQLDPLVAQISEANSVSQLDSAKQDLGRLTSLLEDMDDKGSKGFRTKLSQLDKRIAEKRQQAISQQKANEITQLFNVLESSIENSLDDSVLASLSASWRQRLTDPTRPGYSRLELNVLLDILHEVPSSDAEQSLRSELQLTLMSKKLQEGVTLTAKDVLNMWLQHGAVEPQQKALLERLKKHVDEHAML
ncbi:DUF349 domain-containing protein [Aliiglaciecola litoralis]|uniref:DUF349 domain-containing protein n=1 Tax=Aliiglaciecola litoralis TaxID=582857 RepID=A0ABN1LLN2_9ALTE